jgi:hypothetical protein
VTTTGSRDGDDDDSFLREAARLPSVEEPLPIVPFDLLTGPPTVDARRWLRVAGPEALPIVDPTAYEILGEIARGGMGRILLAFDRRLGRRVALKELLPGAGASAAARLVREALVTARLDHPGVVPVYEAGRWPSGVPFFAMKLVAGRSLASLVAAAGDDETARRRLARHLPAACATVAYAHERGVLHRDLKPGNLLVDELDNVYVIDWGVALLLDAEGEASLPASSIVGTPGYQAPEQAAGGAVDGRTDVYGLGVTLRSIVGDAPELAAIAAKATAREVSARYESVAALGEAIAAVLDGAGVSPSPSPSPSRSRPRPPSVRREAAAPPRDAPMVAERRAARRTKAPPSRPGRLVVGALALAGAAGLAAWGLTRHPSVAVRTPVVTAALAPQAAPSRAEALVAAARASLATDPTAAVRRLKALDFDRSTEPVRAGAVEIVEEAARRGVARAEIHLPPAERPVAVATDGATFASLRRERDQLVLLVGGTGADGAPVAHVAIPLPAPLRAAAQLAPAISLDGKRAAVVAADGHAATWAVDERPPRLLATPTCPAGAAPRIALAADGAVALCAASGRARVVDAARGQTLAEVATSLVALSLDGALAIAAPPPRIWPEAPPMVQIPPTLAGSRPLALALAPHRTAIAAVAADGRILVADAPPATGALRTLAPAGPPAESIAFTQDAAWLVATQPGGALLAALADGHRLWIAGEGGLAAAATSPDGDTLALLETSGRLRLYALDTLATPSTHAVADGAGFRRWLDALTALGPLLDAPAQQPNIR